MPNNENLKNRIEIIKNDIADIKEYLNSDFYLNCIRLHNKMLDLEKQLKVLENECN